MLYILLLSLSLFLFIINKFFLNNFNKILLIENLIDKNYKKPQAFHTNPTPRIGGLFFIINFSFLIIIYSIYNEISSIVILFSILPFFLIGFLDDLKILENPKYRIFLLIFFIFLSVFFLEIKIENTGFYYINNWLAEYVVFKYFFLILCFLTIINGSNFIDGFNGLLIIQSIIILSILVLINSSININNQLIIVLICLGSILIFNFPKSKIFLGDSGAYSIGFLISYYVIQASNLNLNISPMFFCILLFYIFFEVLFSFIRKKIYNLNPILPDKNHLHMIIFRIINFKFNDKSKSNYFTSITINFFYFLIVFPSLFFYDNNFLCKIYFTICLFIYVIFYVIINNYEKKIFKFDE